MRTFYIELKVIFQQIRVGWVLEAMRIYLQISGQKSVDVDNLSPFQVRILLQKVLTVSEWASEEKYASSSTT